MKLRLETLEAKAKAKFEIKQIVFIFNTFKSLFFPIYQGRVTELKSSLVLFLFVELEVGFDVKMKLKLRAVNPLHNPRLQHVSQEVHLLTTNYKGPKQNFSYPNPNQIYLNPNQI